MRTYTFIGGKITPGLELVSDERIGLDRGNPPAVENGRVMNATVRQVKPREGAKQFRPFFVLEKSVKNEPGRYLVRVNTRGGYTRDWAGTVSVHRGDPKVVVSGEGRHGLAGGLPGWEDALVLLRDGDVLQVTREGNIARPHWAIFVEGGEPRSLPWADFLAHEGKVAATQAEAATTTYAFGRMPAFTYAGKNNPERGIKTAQDPTLGCGIILGEVGRGRRRTVLPVVGGEHKLIRSAAVLKSGSTYVLDFKTEASQAPAGTALILFPLRSKYGEYNRVEPARGGPVRLAHGYLASGEAGRAGGADQDVWVMSPGDVLRVADSFAVEKTVEGFVIKGFDDWEYDDAFTRSNAYLVEKGRVRIDCVPDEWVGRVVTCAQWPFALGGTQSLVGEVVSTQPLVLNLGWDGRDRKEVCVSKVLPFGLGWARLTDKKPWAVEGQEKERRIAAQKKAADLSLRAQEAAKAPSFRWLSDDLRHQVDAVAEGIDILISSTDGIEQFVVRAESVFDDLPVNQVVAEELEARRSSGEVLPEFDCWVKTRGQSGRGDGWVIRPDGTERPHDRNVGEDKSSVKRWDLVSADELALRWRQSTHFAEPELEVAHLPTGSCTEAQLAWVGAKEDTLEREGVEMGKSGYGRERPQVGDGWGIPGTPRRYKRGPGESKPASSGTDGDADSPFAKLAALRKQTSDE